MAVRSSDRDRRAANAIGDNVFQVRSWGSSRSDVNALLARVCACRIWLTLALSVTNLARWAVILAITVARLWLKTVFRVITFCTQDTSLPARLNRPPELLVVRAGGTGVAQRPSDAGDVCTWV